ncbi:MAG: hypothetical protein H7069_14035 [Phormidesmis sp. FL-bin-119]|nr:hypothetical protein [Pedobacter sp.]
MKSNAKEPNTNRVIIIGAAAGGLQAIKKLVSQLQPNFPANVDMLSGKLKQIMGLNIAVIQTMPTPSLHY